MRAATATKCWILCLLALASQSIAEAERVKGPLTEDGEIVGAPFQIMIPENWNGGLIMFAHGYEAVAPNRSGYDGRISEVGKRFGFAVAQSKYSVQGWAAREGILDTEALRRYFVQKYGKTSPTIIAGGSQGGMITHRTIELYPEVYDGAMPMCTTGEPTLMFFKQRAFDMRLLFDYFMPGLPGSVVDFPFGPGQMAAIFGKVQILVRENPEKAEKFIKLVNLPRVNDIATALALFTEILRELKDRTGGNAFDNRDTIYSGSEDDAALNREIKRYSADPKSVEYLRQWVTPTGKISDPVVALHTLVDQLIPPADANYYERLAEVNGSLDNYVQLYVTSVGHCNFNVDEMSEAFQRLLTWIKDKKRPEAGDVSRPKKEESH